MSSKPTVDVGFVVVEMAKTGQSRCRKCADPIPKGELRVGLEAWISGRKAVTWQHPPCFLQGLRFAAATTGRSKCKATGDLMPKVLRQRGVSMTPMPLGLSWIFQPPQFGPVFSGHCGLVAVGIKARK